MNASKSYVAVKCDGRIFAVEFTSEFKDQKVVTAKDVMHALLNEKAIVKAERVLSLPTNKIGRWTGADGTVFPTAGIKDMCNILKYIKELKTSHIAVWRELISKWFPSDIVKSVAASPSSVEEKGTIMGYVASSRYKALIPSCHHTSKECIQLKDVSQITEVHVNDKHASKFTRVCAFCSGRMNKPRKVKIVHSKEVAIDPEEFVSEGVSDDIKLGALNMIIDVLKTNHSQAASAVGNKIGRIEMILMYNKLM